VYLAGVIAEDRINGNSPRVAAWRDEIFGVRRLAAARGLQGRGYCQGGRFVYGSPNIFATPGGHLAYSMECPHEVERRIIQVRHSNVLFAWIDREDLVGPIAEVAIAREHGRTVFIAYKNEDGLAGHFYFLKSLANRVIVAPDARAAWQEFEA